MGFFDLTPAQKRCTMNAIIEDMNNSFAKLNENKSSYLEYRDKYNYWLGCIIGVNIYKEFTKKQIAKLQEVLNNFSYVKKQTFFRKREYFVFRGVR